MKAAMIAEAIGLHLLLEPAVMTGDWHMAG